jgi:hypothetical protein
MDLPALALHTRAEVEKVLGKPSKYIYRRSKGELADEADYPWGSVGYNHSRFNFLIYKFQSKPDSYEKAFQLLKLPPPNPPYVREVDGTQIWHDVPFHSAFTCCGTFSPDDIFISGNGAEIHVLILDMDDPQGWNDQQCAMYIQLTGLPLPEAARLRGDPTLLPIIR